MGAAAYNEGWLCITANLTANVAVGSKPECLPKARTSALASCGHATPRALFCHVTILLQKSGEREGKLP
jgi:hypothetical protein